MARISAVFIALCMVLIAASLGMVTYLRFGFTVVEAAIVGVGVLTALSIYSALAARTRDRAEASAQISGLSRNSADLARQLAEFGLRLSGMERKVEQVLERSLSAVQPLAAELEELSTLVKQLADSVAGHELALNAAAAARRAEPAAAAASAPASQADALPPPIPTPGTAPVVPTSAAVFPTPAAVAAFISPAPAPAPSGPMAAAVGPAAAASPMIAAFKGLDRGGIIALVRDAIEAGRIDLYLQPIVMLPQRKVRFYEGMSRLKAENGDVVAAGDFLKYAEAGSLMPKLDHLTALRCVQVVRRLLLKNRDIGLFCNLSSSTLTDAEFPSLLEFMEANRAIAGALVFEFSQSAVRAMGPLEHEGLSALAERGFRFSMDNLADLRLEPRELTARGFRYVKAPASLLLNRAGAASTDIHPADFSDLLGRFGIDLVADRIEQENTVVDLLDYDVRFGQGHLFAPPRPVRAEALQVGAAEPEKDAGKSEASAELKGAAALATAAASDRLASPPRGTLAQLARASSARN